MTTINTQYKTETVYAEAVEDSDVPAEGETLEGGDLLPPTGRLELTGDVGAQIAAMLIKAGREGKEAAKRSREAAGKAELEAFDRKIEAMKDAATERLIGGIAGGVMTAASGAATAAGGASGTAKANQLQGAAKIYDASGGVTKVLTEFVAAGSDREQAAAERAEKQAAREVENAGDASDDAGELIAKALQAYRDYVAGKDAAQSAAILKA